MFNIGDKVVSKKTGQPVYGTVVGICTSDFFINTRKYGNVTTVWEKLYPSWREKCVCSVKFDNPITPISFQELKEQSDPGLSDEILNYLYSKYPKAWVAEYPEEDLELFEFADLVNSGDWS